MHDRTDRIAHTTAFVTPVVEHWLELEIIAHEGSIRRPIAPWANALNHGATSRSYFVPSLEPIVTHRNNSKHMLIAHSRAIVMNVMVLLSNLLVTFDMLVYV